MRLNNHELLNKLILLFRYEPAHATMGQVTVAISHLDPSACEIRSKFKHVFVKSVFFVECNNGLYNMDLGFHLRYAGQEWAS